MRLPSLIGLSLAVLAGCAGEDVELSVANTGPTGDSLGGYVSVRTMGGNPDRPNNPDTLEVETRSDGGPWQPAEWATFEHVTPPLVDVVLVADNSGSEADYIEEIRDAVAHFGHTMMVRQPEDRMGLVRVSTVPSVLVPLTDEKSQIQDAAEGLFTNRGWTALWKGIWLANEVLIDDALTPAPTGLCMERAFRSVVVFTDGQDNNSAGEQETSYAFDGIEVALEDLFDLEVYSTKTPVHTIGVGNDVNYDDLELLAEKTGGKSYAIRNFQGLQGVLHGTAAQLQNYKPFCFAPSSCSDTEARVVLTRVTNRGETITRTFEMPIDATCID